MQRGLSIFQWEVKTFVVHFSYYINLPLIFFYINFTCCNVLYSTNTYVCNQHYTLEAIDIYFRLFHVGGCARQ